MIKAYFTLLGLKLTQDVRVQKPLQMQSSG